ncbi:MAG: phosphoglycerate kinase [Bacteroidia bacterium]|nr:phosphoglycerate kinase [Bacteroidia bacterium]
MQTIENYDFSGKKALIRVDFNVPLDENFVITDDTRMTAALPTIKKVIENGGAAIIMSHLGRPKKGPEDKFSMRHLVPHLSEILGGIKVKIAPDCIGDATKKMAAALKPGEILVLENLRFHPEEEGGDVEFAKQIAELGDCWINDAFGIAHRAHASTAVIAQFFPKDKLFGYLVDSEVKSLDKVLKAPRRPFTAIMGGSKVSSKITIIENLLNSVDNLIIGGGMTYTFMKAQGGKIGGSLCEDDFMPMALDILKKAEQKGVKIVLAVDVIEADAFAETANTRVVPSNKIDDGWSGLDIGPKTIEMFRKVISESKTILWNGPVGVFEIEKFATGTKAIGDAIVEATSKGAFSLVGGGDSVAAVNKFGIADKVSYISTAGGAMLEYLEGRVLPGIAAVLE